MIYIRYKILKYFIFMSVKMYYRSNNFLQCYRFQFYHSSTIILILSHTICFRNKYCRKQVKPSYYVYTDTMVYNSTS